MLIKTTIKVLWEQWSDTGQTMANILKDFGLQEQERTSIWPWVTLLQDKLYSGCELDWTTITFVQVRHVQQQLMKRTRAIKCIPSHVLLNGEGKSVQRKKKQMTKKKKKPLQKRKETMNWTSYSTVVAPMIPEQSFLHSAEYEKSLIYAPQAWMCGRSTSWQSSIIINYFEQIHL